LAQYAEAMECRRRVRQWLENGVDGRRFPPSTRAGAGLRCHCPGCTDIDELHTTRSRTTTARAGDSEWISRSRLRVETRLKLLAKWDPKRYGDKSLLGSDPDNPLPTGVNVTFRNTDAASGD
jgi:hypothetical protein